MRNTRRNQEKCIERREGSVAGRQLRASGGPWIELGADELRAIAGGAKKPRIVIFIPTCPGPIVLDK
jgi:hypothetical protein